MELVVKPTKMLLANSLRAWSYFSMKTFHQGRLWIDCFAHHQCHLEMPFLLSFYVFLLLISRLGLRESALGSDSAKSRKSSQSRLLCFVVTAIAKLATYHRELLPRARVSLTKVLVSYHLPEKNRLSWQQFDQGGKMPPNFGLLSLIIWSIWLAGCTFANLRCKGVETSTWLLGSDEWTCYMFVYLGLMWISK